MKLKDFIAKALECIEEGVSEVTFDLGVESDMKVNPNSLNRIKFKVTKCQD